MEHPARARGGGRGWSPSPGGVALAVVTLAFLWPADAASDQLRLTWVDSATDESGFSIERRGAGESAFAEIAVVAANATSYVDAGVAAQGTYCYRVRAFNASGPSAYSNEACGTATGTEILAAVLPSSRAVPPGSVATVFGTIVNPGAGPALGCEIGGSPGAAVTVTYQAIDAATNRPVAAPDLPVDIAAGAAQAYLIALAPAAVIEPTELALRFQCRNTRPAPSVVGVNTLLFSAPGGLSADVVAVAATRGNDGIVEVPGAPGTGLFTVGSTNVGDAAAMTVEPDTGSASLPLTLTLCETRAGLGDCVAPPAPTVTVEYEAGTERSFAIFVAGRGPIVFNPAMSRVFVRFRDAAGGPRGATSVAVRTRP